MNEWEIFCMKLFVLFILTTDIMWLMAAAGSCSQQNVQRLTHSDLKVSKYLSRKNIGPAGIIMYSCYLQRRAISATVSIKSIKYNNVITGIKTYHQYIYMQIYTKTFEVL